MIHHAFTKHKRFRVLVDFNDMLKCGHILWFLETTKNFLCQLHYPMFFFRNGIDDFPTVDRLMPIS